MRVHRRHGSALAMACALATLVAAPAAGAAPAAPQLLGAAFDHPPVTAAPSTLTLQASGARPVSGVVVAFADGTFGESACRPKARRQVTFAVPHVFTAAGPQPLGVRLDDGGCSGGGSALTQPYTVTPVNPGDPPAPDPLVPGLPVVAPALPAGTTVPTVPALPLPLPSAPGVALPVRATVAAAGCPGADQQPMALGLPRARKVLLCLINAARASQGRRPLRANHRLSIAAASHSRDMVAEGFFAHVSPSGSTPISRVKAARYIRRGYQAGVGENVGFGEAALSTPLGLIQAWMASTTHRTNILDRDWREVGLGIAPGIPGNPASGATYTTDFGMLVR